MTKRLLKITVLFTLLMSLVYGCLLFAWFSECRLIRQMDTAAVTTAIQIRSVHPQIVFTDPKLEYLGRYKLTYYCACAKCCGKTDGITASGAHVQANHTIAVDPSVIPLGSQVLINGIVYTAEDTGSAIQEKRIDIYVETHDEALRRGVNYADVYLLTD